jgi:hypothetical protein
MAVISNAVNLCALNLEDCHRESLSPTSQIGDNVKF